MIPLDGLAQEHSIFLTFFLPKIVLAILCGVVIGLDRELKGKAAGLRTCIIVCLGAAIFSSLAFLSFKNNPGIGDPMRVIAQVVSGIGFLGAGVIFRGQNSVSGMTTGAILWLMGAIGCMIGVELYVSALAVSVACVSIIVFIGGLESMFFKSKRMLDCYSLLFKVRASDQEAFNQYIHQLMSDLKIDPLSLKIIKASDYWTYEMRYFLETEDHRSFGLKLSQNSLIIDFDQTKC